MTPATGAVHSTMKKAFGPLQGFVRAVSRTFRVGLILVLLLSSAACLHRHHHKTTQIPTQPPPPGNYPAPQRPPRPPGGVIEQGQEGIASWYGPTFNGKETSNGEIYNMYAFTAAHRTLPFGARVRVYNLENGASVDVRINDRGPFVEGRIIDLSYSAAQSIGMLGPGTTLVRLQILNPAIVNGPEAVPGIFAVQVGAFKDPANAERLRAMIEPRFSPVTIQSYNGGAGVFYRVRVGQVGSEDAALALAAQLRQANLTSVTFVVRLN
ncbi:MAG TPA: septal ring lytic transglycosylase RlpA family protein [Terriglobia bacterium]|nr:septal ring lytic transglycosylase RlpA family protein [Terriglobia bacterium]